MYKLDVFFWFFFFHSLIFFYHWINRVVEIKQVHSRDLCLVICGLQESRVQLCKLMNRMKMNRLVTKTYLTENI